MEVQGQIHIARILVGVLLLSCLSMAASIGKGREGQLEIEVDWGTKGVTLRCETDPAFNISADKLYWKRNNEDFVIQWTNGGIHYRNGASAEKEKVEEDSSLSLAEVDWDSAGSYTCLTEHETEFEFENKSQITLKVKEPSLLVEGCNATGESNHSHLSCKILVPNGTEYMNMTFTKLAIRDVEVSHNITSDVKIVSNSTLNTRNEDNSTSYATSYQLEVSQLTTSAELHYKVVDDEGNVIGEFDVVFMKSEAIIIEATNEATNIYIGVTVSVVFCIGLTLFVVFWIMHRIRDSPRGRRSESSELSQYPSANGDPVTQPPLEHV